MQEQFGDRWTAIRELGAGGQGKVYLVQDRQTDRSANDVEDALIEAGKVLFTGLATVGDFEEVRQRMYENFRAGIIDIVNSQNPARLGALKVLHDPKDARDPKLARERIKREIDVMSKNLHPSILRILDQGEESESRLWYVSQYCPEGTLDQHPDLFRGDVYGALRAFRPLVDAVTKIHWDGHVHRDIKPHNIFLAADSSLVLGDFGLVFTDDNGVRISETFENVGSRDWMPGWAQGLRVDKVSPAFDVFSLGKVLWSMVSGKPLLQFWYFRRPQFDLECQFPNDRHVRLLNGLLAKCIVENEVDCLMEAGPLLLEIDDLIERIERGGDDVGGNIARPCRVCGVGQYALTVDQNVADTHNFGLNPAGVRSFKIFTCNHCGHVQLFAFHNGSPPAWAAI